jgi:hypothetical protein
MTPGGGTKRVLTAVGYTRLVIGYQGLWWWEAYRELGPTTRTGSSPSG